MPSGWYNKGLYTLANGDAPLASSTFKAMLLNASHAFDRDQNYVSDISANELTVSGYARQTISAKTLTQNDVNDAVYWDAENPIFGPLAIGETAVYMVVYAEIGTDATSPLICCWQIVPHVTANETFEFPFATAGITKIWSLT